MGVLNGYMLYDINGNQINSGTGSAPDAKAEETAQKIYQIQLTNMMLFQRERLFNIVDQCNSALEKMAAPDHKLEVRLIRQIRDKALETINQESVAGYVSGMQTRMAYEICEKLVAEAKLFDGEDGTECQELMQTLIQLTLKKLDAETNTSPESAAVESANGG